MKKRIFVLVVLVISLITVLCACGKNSEIDNNTNNSINNELTIKLENCTVNLSSSKDYLLESFSEGKSTGFAVFYNDEEADNFAIGSFLASDSFEHFKLGVVVDENVQTIYENTDDFLYYSVTNADNSSLTEYNRIIRLNDDYVMYLGSFDKEAVDALYATLKFNVK